MEVGEDVLDPRLVVRPPLDPVSTCPQQYRPYRAGTSSGKLQKTSKKPLPGCQVKPPDSYTPMKLTVLGPHELSHGHTDDQLECRLPWQSPRSIGLCGSSWYLWCCGSSEWTFAAAPPPDSFRVPDVELQLSNGTWHSLRFRRIQVSNPRYRDPFRGLRR